MEPLAVVDHPLAQRRRAAHRRRWPRPSPSRLAATISSRTEFGKAATTRFGSGWAWLCKQADGSLQLSARRPTRTTR
ncbi:MAG: Fe-Mn family superoxide dismutase [Hymenobacter sp.]